MKDPGSTDHFVREVVNDFSIRVATVNGSGSQTSNLVLLRALFVMGIPVAGKNVFPSNIQGMPSWYSIRCSRDGHVAHRERAEISVLMNPDTVDEDVQTISSNGVCFYPDHIVVDNIRDDLTYYPIPVKQLSRVGNVSRSLRNYLANMVYVGALARMLDIEMDAIEAALDWQFGGREKLININLPVIQAAYDWAADGLMKSDPYRAERMNGTDGYILLDGNTAAALGAIYGGMTVAAWYPITPSTSLADALTKYASELRRDDHGRSNYAIIQAEDELAAIGMVLGAGWAGARAMTATSGPGISLMAEFAGYGYYAEVPAVIWDVQRVGPSTGLPTRTSQGDILSCYWLSHGDTRHVCLMPGSVSECFEFGWRAFDLADELQTPIFVLSDLDLGMNTWMTKPFDYPDEPMRRGKVMTAEDVQNNGFHRYKDVDGDGIPYRTLPGTDHPQAAYFTRGSGHDADAHYTENSKTWLDNMERLRRKFESAREYLPEPVIDIVKGSEVGLVGFGSTDVAIGEARKILDESGLKTSYLRIRALPANQQLKDFITSLDRVYVVEMNLEGQLHKLIQLEWPELAVNVRSAAFSDGMPMRADTITSIIQRMEGSQHVASK